MNQPNAKIAEQLWLRAHDHIRRGNLAQAVRDLAKSFEILKALGDPRIRQVHEKWIAVHKLYKEEQQSGGPTRSVAQADAKTLQAQAEEAANRGDLTRAITLYQRVLGGAPDNELARERLAELKRADERARELQAQRAQPAPVAQPAPAAQPVTPTPAYAEQPAPAAAAAPEVVHTQPMTAPVRSASSTADNAGQVAYLETLLARIQERRRAV